MIINQVLLEEKSCMLSVIEFFFSLHGGYNFIDVEDVSRSIYQASLLNINEQIILSAHEITIRGLYEMIERVTKKEKMDYSITHFSRQNRYFVYEKLLSNDDLNYSRKLSLR